MFLYLCMCRYRYVKNEQKQSKTDKKTSTRMEKGQKPEPGKQNDQRMLNLSLEVLKNS